MAKAKNKARPKAASVKPAAATIATASKAGRTLGPDQLLPRLPALDETHRDAFTSQFTDAQCSELGTKTKSSAVRDGALAWAGDAATAVLDPALAPSIDY